MQKTTIFNVSRLLIDGGSSGFVPPPFGMQIQNREYTSSGGGYRFGFNGMERDDELKGDGNSLDFGARIYDSRLGRFMSKDILACRQFWGGIYSFAANTPILAIDECGKWPRYSRKHKMVTASIKLYQNSDTYDAAQMCEYEQKVLTSISSGFEANGIRSNITIEWLAQGDKGGLFNTGLFSGWFSDKVFIEVDGREERSYAEKGGAKVFLNDTTLSTEKTSTPFHEFLHLMGLSDRYSYKFSIKRRGDREMTAQGGIPIGNIQIDENDYNPLDNAMSGHSYTLSMKQIETITKWGPGFLHREKSYTQIAFEIKEADFDQAQTVDFVNGNISVNGKKFRVTPRYIYSNSIGKHEKTGANVKGNLDGVNYYNTTLECDKDCQTKIQTSFHSLIHHNGED